MLLASVAGGLAAAFGAGTSKVMAGLDPKPPRYCPQGDKKCEVRVEADDARKELNLGDAEAAADRFEAARVHWQKAVDLGFETGSQAAIVAQKRLQMYTLSCSFNKVSLAKLSEMLANPYPNCLVNTAVLQQALCVLGYYQGAINGELTENTRTAIRKYQRDMAFDETGVLTPRQVVLLIANGAETARDENSQTTLALMYASGVGVVQSLPFALAWLTNASGRGYGKASLYLALLKGTGFCGFPVMLDHATQYMREACQQKEPSALLLQKKYGGIADSVTRWAKIGSDPVSVLALQVIGPTCNQRPKPNRI